jgi:hypothetical protein
MRGVSIAEQVRGDTGVERGSFASISGIFGAIAADFGQHYQ